MRVYNKRRLQSTNLSEMKKEPSIIFIDLFDGNQSVMDLIKNLLKNKYRQCIVIGIFGNNKPYPDPETKFVHLSGEPEYKDPKLFHLSLIHHKTDIEKRIVFFPYFTLFCELYNHWDRILKPRLFENSFQRKFCLFVVSNPRCEIRNNFFKKLCAYKKVDSCGKVLNNTEIIAPRDFKEYEHFCSQYKFMICFENSSDPYYITEKIVNGFLGNTIPIYWGCPNSKKWLNPKSFLYLPESATENEMNILIEQIKELDNNHEKYNQYFSEPLINSEIPKELSIKEIQESINLLP